MKSFQNTLSLILAGTLLTALIGCGGIEEPFSELNSEGKAEHLSPEQRTWPTTTIPLIYCNLVPRENMTLECKIEKEFQPDPMHTGKNISFHIRVKSASSKIAVDQDFTSADLIKGIVLELKGVITDAEVSLTADIPIIAENKAPPVDETVRDSIVCYATKTLNYKNPKVVLEAPFKVWKLQFISFDIDEVQNVHLHKEYRLPHNYGSPNELYMNSFKTIQKIDLNEWPEVYLVTPLDSEEISFSLGGKRHELKEPGIYTILYTDTFLIRPSEDRDFTL